ncbi:MAG: NPCBM/NEW2 domain-containing protein, partial [Tannerellaceae bacterium]|nr:NPCBM/NEW2 domain-containing protein [Tannerellaceae bacterium]
MNKCTFIVSLLVSSALFVSPVTGQKKADNWIDASVKQKAELRKDLQQVNMPVKSPWVKSGQQAVPMAADVTGQQKLVLITAGGPDGFDYDWGTWANARLIKADGSSVWLDDLKPSYWESGSGSLSYNKNLWNQPLQIAGKKYEHGIVCHAAGVMIFDLDGEYTRFETEVGISHDQPQGSVYFTISNTYPKELAAQMFSKYPAELGAFSASIGGLEGWLISTDTSVEQEVILDYVSQMKDQQYFKNAIQQIEAEQDIDKRATAYLQLFEQVLRVFNLQHELEWLNMEAIRLAFDDMSKMPEYDKATYQPLMNELEQLVKQGFDNIYAADEAALTAAEKAVANKKAILLGNPFLDGDRIVAARYKLGPRARIAMAPDLGTQANNWSNQESARRMGFDAEVVEMSNLRGDIQMRPIFKPEGTSSIADLKLHWDGDRVMFTTTQPDNRWNVFEVKLDGSDFKPLVEIDEPDLEFYDGTWLPDGRVIANSNIGYQGVPCVSGDDPVGNMVLYNPKDKSMRRLTFDQDANWNPVIMSNGRVMYTRWEYTDLTHYFSRIVMHMNPDGTENKALYGSGSMFPNSTFDMQPLPG